MIFPEEKTVESVNKKPLTYGLLTLAVVVSYLFIDNRILHTRIEEILETNTAKSFERSEKMTEVVVQNTHVIQQVLKALESK